MGLSEFIKLYRDFYTNDEILFEMLKSTKNKELALINPNFTIRCMYASSIKFLKWNINEFGAFNQNMSNFYFSLANVNNMPVFSFNRNLRQEQQEKFNPEFEKYVTGFDMFIDLDKNQVPEPNKMILKRLGLKSPDLKTYIKAYLIKDMKRLKEVFDENKIPYSIRFSGSGFHFVINDKYLPNYSVNDKVKFCKNFAFDLKNWFAVDSIDLSIYDLRRLAKIPYTIDIKTGNVCMPLDDKQAENFDYNDYYVANLVNSSFRGRGLLIRNDDNNNKNFLKLVEHMGVKAEYPLNQNKNGDEVNVSSGVYKQ